MLLKLEALLFPCENSSWHEHVPNQRSKGLAFHYAPRELSPPYFHEKSAGLFWDDVVGLGVAAFIIADLSKLWKKAGSDFQALTAPTKVQDPGHDGAWPSKNHCKPWFCSWRDALRRVLFDFYRCHQTLENSVA